MTVFLIEFIFCPPIYVGSSNFDTIARSVDRIWDPFSVHFGKHTRKCFFLHYKFVGLLREYFDLSLTTSARADAPLPATYELFRSSQLADQSANISIRRGEKVAHIVLTNYDGQGNLYLGGSYDS